MRTCVSTTTLSFRFLVVWVRVASIVALTVGIPVVRVRAASIVVLAVRIPIIRIGRAGTYKKQAKKMSN